MKKQERETREGGRQTDRQTDKTSTQTWRIADRKLNHN